MALPISVGAVVAPARCSDKTMGLRETFSGGKVWLGQALGFFFTQHELTGGNSGFSGPAMIAEARDTVSL